MKLGVDFGTTRIVVAAADRGNYPLVHFDTADGGARDWWPPLIACRSGELLYGWDTWPVQSDPEWTVIRSIKRMLKDGGPRTAVEIDGRAIPLLELLCGMLAALNRHLRFASTLHAANDEPFDVMIGVPANANSNQRFLTAEAFRAAGFRVLGMLNEPSAASVEFGHRDRTSRKGQTRSLLVYDLGGGTFDASLVGLGDETHAVVATASIPDLGGDDFDEALADLALETAGISGQDRDSITGAELFRLLDECQERKETLTPNTRKIVIDLDRVRDGWGEVAISASDYYERCRPLIEQTEALVTELIDSQPGHTIETLYVTGGGSELPAVARVLKETFGRRVRRSAYMRSATAIGLAISSDSQAAYTVRDRFSEHFGVWREADHGQNIQFDVLFRRGLELPPPGAEPLRTIRSYHPAHNIGYFRYVECSSIGEDGQPKGDLTVWDNVRFPFDPALLNAADLSSVPISRGGEAPHQWVQEEYSCDASGMLKVTIANTSAGYRREYALGRWSGETKRVPATRPVRRRHLHGS